MADKTVKLNLVLTAQDDAKTVIETFARNLTETFDGLGPKLAEAMNMNAVKTAISDALKSSRSDLRAIKTAFTDEAAAAKDASNATKTATTDMKNAVNDLKTPFTSDMAQMIEDIKRYEASIKEAATETTTATKTIDEDIKRAAQEATSDFHELDNALKATKEDMNNAKSAAEGTKKALDFANLQMAGQTIKDTGKSIVGFFIDSATQAADFDQNVMNVVASLNANLPDATQVAGMSLDTLKQKYDATFDNGRVVMTSDAVKKLNDRALQLGSSGYFSANQVAEAMNTLARQGISYKDIMSGAIDTVTNVAAANQQDIESTANVVSDIIHEMGGSLTKEFGSDRTKQMAAVGDALTAALHHGRLSMDDFLNTMKYVGPQASNLGISFTDLSASIALLAEHGIKGSQAGTGLRRELTNLLPQSKEAAAWMQKLGMTTKDVADIFVNTDGSMKSLTEVQQILHDKMSTLTPAMQQMAEKAIFGQYALAAVATISKTAPSEFKSLSDAMQKTGVTADILADKSKGLGMQIQQAKAHFSTIKKEIGDELRPEIERVIAVFQNLMNAWQSLSPHTQKMIINFALISGAVLLVGGSLLAFLGTMGMLIIGLEPVIEILGVVAGAFSGPVLIAVGAAIAIIAALVYAWKNDFGGIREVTQQAWTFVREQFAAAVNYLRPFMTLFANDLKTLFQAIGQAFKVVMDDIMFVVKAFTPVWKADWAFISGILKAVWDVMAGIIDGALKIITGVINIFIGLLTGNWKQCWDGLKEVLNGVVAIIEGIIKGFIDILEGDLNAAMAFIKNLGPQARQWGVNMIQQFIDGIMSKIHDVENAVSAVASKITSFLGHHSPAETGPMADDDTWMPNMMNMFTQGISQNVPQIQAAVNGVALGIKTAVTNPTTVNNAYTLPNATNAQRGAVVVNINIDGRSAKTDNDLAEMIASKFRTQMSIVSAR